MADAIVVQSLSKHFRRYHVDRPKTFKEALVRRFRRVRPVGWFWALQDVSFRVPHGRMVGVVGANGSGKSTLLRIISGVVRPTEGNVKVHGRIGALIDLGTGFHPDLTGRESIFVAGVIAGLTRSEIAQRFDSIVDFSELQEFVDSPLRTYSTGMQMRLAFAVAVHTEPKVLLIDEMLSVGDVAFQGKCLEKIRQFKIQGSTIVVVSHDTKLVEKLCDEALWLRQGRLEAQGDPGMVIGRYVAEFFAETHRRTPRSRPVLRTPMGTELRVNENRFGSFEMEIVSVRLLNADGLPLTEIDSGDALCVEINFVSPQPIDGAIFWVSIKRNDGFVCSEINTQSGGFRLPTLHGQGCITLYFSRLDLIAGKYDIHVAVYERSWAYAYDFHQQVYLLLVRPTAHEKGVLNPPHHWEFGNSQLPEL